MHPWRRQLALASALAFPGYPADAQMVDTDRAESCDMVEVTIRLRGFHPLGAARSANRQCLAHTAQWVATEPMAEHERLAWRSAVAQLSGSPLPTCQLAARTLVWLEQTGTVSVWAPADTAAGNVYFGATYLTDGGSPLALQLWSRAFERGTEWLAAALAHEAFHVLRPKASELEALTFGERCGRQLASPRSESSDSPGG